MTVFPNVIQDKSNTSDEAILQLLFFFTFVAILIKKLYIHYQVRMLIIGPEFEMVSTISYIPQAYYR